MNQPPGFPPNNAGPNGLHAQQPYGHPQQGQQPQVQPQQVQPVPQQPGQYPQHQNYGHPQRYPQQAQQPLPPHSPYHSQQHGQPHQPQGAFFGHAPVAPPQPIEEPSTLHKAGGGVLALLTLLATVFFALTDSGPFFMLASLQADMMDGDYYPSATFLLVWLGMLMVVAPIWLGIVSAIEGRNAFRVAINKAMSTHE